jgi:hypothetical protein
MLLPCVIRPEFPAHHGTGPSGVPLKLYVPGINLKVNHSFSQYVIILIGKLAANVIELNEVKDCSESYSLDRWNSL